MFKGTIIENSLRDPSILQSLKIEKTWQDGSWTLHNVLVDENAALQIGSHLADGPWYIHFWKPGDDNVLVVFKDKNFWITYSDKSTWADAIAYGKSIGIPEEQLDFLIHDEEREIMDRLKTKRIKSLRIESKGTCPCMKIALLWDLKLSIPLRPLQKRR